jgi:hypothetical protein
MWSSVYAKKIPFHFPVSLRLAIFDIKNNKMLFVEEEDIAGSFDDEDDEESEDEQLFLRLPVTVANNSAPATHTKPQIPWRNPVKSIPLYECLFRLAVTQRIHLITKKDSKESWDRFADMLFKQPEFATFEKITVKVLRSQFDNYIKVRAKHHGWMAENGGVTGNLSDHAGDLSGPDKYIKQILNDKEELEAAKKLKKDLTKNLEKNELEALVKGIAGGSKANAKKRKSINGEIIVRSEKTSLTAPPTAVAASNNEGGGGEENARNEGELIIFGGGGRNDDNNNNNYQQQQKKSKNSHNKTSLSPSSSFLFGNSPVIVEDILSSVLSPFNNIGSRNNNIITTAAATTISSSGPPWQKITKFFEQMEQEQKGKAMEEIAIRLNMENPSADFGRLKAIGIPAIARCGFKSNGGGEFDLDHFTYNMEKYRLDPLHAMQLGIYVEEISMMK